MKNAVFRASTDSWIAVTPRKKSWAPGGYGLGTSELFIPDVSGVCKEEFAGSPGTIR
jgi:hypothetical protein